VKHRETDCPGSIALESAQAAPGSARLAAFENFSRNTVSPPSGAPDLVPPEIVRFQIENQMWLCIGFRASVRVLKLWNTISVHCRWRLQFEYRAVAPLPAWAGSSIDGSGPAERHAPNIMRRTNGANTVRK